MLANEPNKGTDVMYAAMLHVAIHVITMYLDIITSIYTYLQSWLCKVKQANVGHTYYGT